MVRPLLLLCCGLTCSFFSFGQTFRNDSSFVAEARKNTINRYSTAIGGQSHLYNGSAYSEYVGQQGEHPYLVDEWIEGSVVYDGEYYTNVPILYDISLDRVIIDNAFSIKKVMLVNEKVAEFSLGERRFVHLNDRRVPKGYYELAYDGNVKIYARYKKTLQTRKVDYSVVNEFEPRNNYFLYKDGRFRSVRSKGSVIKLLEDKKKELKKFAKDNKLTFGADRVRDMARLAQYYDQLQ